MRTCMLGGGVDEWWKGEIIRLFVGLAPILFVSGMYLHVLSGVHTHLYLM